MKKIILLDTVEHRFEVTDDVAEQFEKDKLERGIIDSTLMEFLSENNRLSELSEETIEHNDYVLNTFEDISE
jgi:hypothetical protein